MGACRQARTRWIRKKTRIRIHQSRAQKWRDGGMKRLHCPSLEHVSHTGWPQKATSFARSLITCISKLLDQPEKTLFTVRDLAANSVWNTGNGWKEGQEGYHTCSVSTYLWTMFASCLQFFFVCSSHTHASFINLLQTL